MKLNEHQQLVAATILGYMQDAPLPVRAPGNEQQGFRGRPIAKSSVQEVADSPAWQTLLTVPSIPQHNAVIREYIASPLYVNNSPLLQFRLRLNSGILDMNLAPGVDRNHRGGVNAFPLVRQKVNSIFSTQSLFAIDVLNQTGGAVVVASAIYGWYYYDTNTELSGAGEAHVDASSPAETGALELFDGY